MLTEVQKHLLSALKEIKEVQDSPKIGICGHVRSWFYRKRGQISDGCYIAYNWELTCNFRVWIEETGSTFSVHYPVGGDIEYYTESAAGTVWDNPKRWELLNWMINRLEALDK